MFDEDFEASWKQRFGVEPAGVVDGVERLLTHRSVRDYSEAAISEETVRALVGAAQSASTSSNLQLWSVVSVQDPERRERAAQLSGNQAHVRNAPWFLVFLADHYRMQRAAQAVGEKAEGLRYEEFHTMSVVDAALACERLVCAAEAIGIGTCYIGAVRNDPQGMKELLGLPEGVFAVFGLCLGYPSESCTASIKPRLRQDDVWFRESYNQEVTTAEYDNRMRPFYEAQKMKGDVTWSMRSGRRLSESKMEGRQVLKSWLAEQGISVE